MTDQKKEDEEEPENLCFGRKKYVGKVNLSMNENHCHPQDGQIKLSQERKDEVWLQVGKLYLNVCAHCFSGKHSKEIRNFKYNIVSWYLCASWSPALLLSLTVIHISPHLDHINFIPERNT